MVSTPVDPVKAPDGNFEEASPLQSLVDAQHDPRIVLDVPVRFLEFRFVCVWHDGA